MHKDGRMTQGEKKTIQAGAWSDSILKTDVGDIYCMAAKLLPIDDELHDKCIQVVGRYMKDVVEYNQQTGKPIYDSFKLSYALVTNVLH